jgi:branched-chain amino acid transport system permease protein
MIFLPLINKKIPALVPMITSLGAYAIFMGLISIIWGNLPIKNDALLSDNLAIYSFSTIHLLSILIEFILLIAYIVVINTKLGLIFRAIQSNTELIQIYGINIVSFLGVFGILSIIYALSAGILRSIDHSIVPTSSFNLYIIGGVVLIIGGLKSKYGFIISALLISLLQSIITLYIDATWSDFFVYMILIIVLIFRPLGFSGKRLKKIEI